MRSLLIAKCKGKVRRSLFPPIHTYMQIVDVEAILFWVEVENRQFSLRGKLVSNAVRYILKVNNCFIWFICIVFSMQRGVSKHS